jgi:hypothetical protein
LTDHGFSLDHAEVRNGREACRLHRYRARHWRQSTSASAHASTTVRNSAAFSFGPISQ